MLVYVFVGGKEVYRVKVDDQDRVTYEALDVAKLAFEEVLTIHPYLVKYEVTSLSDKSNQITQIYVFELGEIISVSV